MTLILFVSFASRERATPLRFYWKTSRSDAWSLISNASTGNGYVQANGTISRPDWAGQPVQVGIAQAIFARPGTPAVDYFTDFELSGPNVKAPPANLPAAPDTLWLPRLPTQTDR